MDPTPLPIPLPVDFGPTITDWLLVALTLFSVIASAIVALMAYLGARDARLIASEARDAEAARLRRTDRERASDRYASLQRAYAKHIVVLGEHSSALAGFIRRSREIMLKPGADLGISPSMNAAIADLHALRLFAQEDREPLAELLGLEISLSATPPTMQLETLASLVSVISRWRVGELTTEQFHARIRVMQEAVDSLPGR